MRLIVGRSVSRAVPIQRFSPKTFLEFRGAVAEEFHQGNTNRLTFIVEPSGLYQSRQFLADLFRQIDIYGFHGNSILQRSLLYCTSGAGHFSHLILRSARSLYGRRGSGRAADFTRRLEGPFNLLDEFPYLVVIEPRAQTQRACLDFEGGNRSGLGSNVQAGAQDAVHDLFEGFARPACFRPELGGHIVVEG